VDKDRKVFGVGTLSLILSLIGIAFGFQLGKNDSLGDKFLSSIGVKIWSKGSNGLHYTVFYSLIFYLVSALIGFKCKDNIGAKIGRNLSLIIILLVVIMIPFLTVRFDLSK
jgi:hypothetical protein